MRIRKLLRASILEPRNTMNSWSYSSQPMVSTYKCNAFPHVTTVSSRTWAHVNVYIKQIDQNDSSRTHLHLHILLRSSFCFSAGRQEVSVDSSVRAKSSTVLLGAKASSGVNMLSELHALQLKLETMESALSRHQHIPVGQEAPAQCTSLITGTQVKATLIVPDILPWYKGAWWRIKIYWTTFVRTLSSWCIQAVVKDVESLRGEFQQLKEQVLTEVEGMKDRDKAQFLHSQLDLINQRLDRLGSHSAAYLLR